MNTPPLPGYAELYCLSNFSFLRGASHPEELVVRAAELGYTALALTDAGSLAGVVRAHQAIQRHQLELQLIVGAELQLEDGPTLVVLARNRNGYAALSRAISRARRAARKGAYRMTRADLEAGLPDCLALLITAHVEEPDDAVLLADTAWLTRYFPAAAWLAVTLACDGNDAQRLEHLQNIARQAGLPAVAASGTLMHDPARRRLADVLTATRLRTTVANAGLALATNAERRLHDRATLAARYPPALLAETLRVAAQCSFRLDELRYEYPAELVPHDHSAASWLRHLVEAGLRWRYPHADQPPPPRVRAQVEHELALIAELHYEAYFLTVHDIVRYARSRDILCQGRGSAANSVVCWTLGITEVSPELGIMLVERFISRERNEPPDIDVDFEHERREEVIQYLYAKYGRERAALAATVICYRPRRARRAVARPPVVRRPRDRARTPARRRPGPDQPDRAAADGTDRSADRLSAPSVATRRWFRHRARAAGRTGAGRKRRDARAHHHPVGQGRPRRPGSAQDRRACAGHAHRAAPHPGAGRGLARPPPDPGRHPARSSASV
jgi:error-prone DNA polymerase